MIFKKTISAVAIFLSLAAQAPIAYAGYFSDVATVNRYYTAIEFLAKNGFVQGYPDGTFQPDRPVNRAEFLKLAMIVSGTSLDAYTSTSFTDVDENAWYAPYVRKALAQGWVQGYGDGTFKPEQGVTKAEGIKMVAEVQGWELSVPTESPYNDTSGSAWYTKYISFAKENGLLEETGSYFIPEAVLSRGKVSDILYRTNIKGFAEGSPIASGTTATETDFKPVGYSTVETTFFDDIKLNETMPNTFYLNEVYYLKGQILKGSYSSVFAFLAPENETNPKDFKNYSGEISGSSFTIPIIFREPGNYRLGVILGTSGESNVTDISVLPELPAAVSDETAEAPTNVKIYFDDGKTTVGWNDGDDGITRITFTQTGKSRTYIFRQDISSFDLDYPDFNSFTAGATKFTAEHAPVESIMPLRITGDFASSESHSFDAIRHDYCMNDTDKLTIVNLPEKFSTIQKLHFTGTNAVNILQKAAIIRPDGKVDTTDLSSTSPTGTFYGSDIIKMGGNFTLNYSPSSKGTYIVEINTQDGEALLNCPVYYTTGIPLIPDFFDMNGHTEKDPKSDIGALRTKLLGYINNERQKMGAEKVTIDASLNNLAQAHSEDMVERNFFGHINPDGKSPDDRRIAAKITTSVGENLADAPTLLYAHSGLMRSAIHRTNIIDPDWTRVGIGIAWDSSGQMLITEEFSTSPISETDILNIETEILKDINSARSSAGLLLMEKDNSLYNVAKEWSTKMVTQNFFDFSSPSGETLISMVQDAVPSKDVEAILVQASSADSLTEKILDGDDPTTASWRKVGIGIKLDSVGKFSATLLFTTY